MKKEKIAPLPDVGFGVEIECALPYVATNASYSTDMAATIVAALAAVGVNAAYGYGSYDRWTVGHDGGTDDLNYRCFEIRTRVLRGEEGLAELARGMAALKGLGAKGGLYCGMHVHVSREGLSDEQLKQWRAAFIRYSLCLDQIVAPWRYLNGYGSTTLITGQMRRDKCVIKRLKRDSIQYGRYSTFAIRDNIPTVEIRQHQSTLDGERAVQWVKLMLMLRERAINDPHGGNKLVEGRSDASFRWFLMSLGLDKTARDYWIAQRAAYATRLNEDVPPGDARRAESDRARYPDVRRRHAEAA